jgi:hypothetical protein
MRSLPNSPPRWGEPAIASKDGGQVFQAGFNRGADVSRPANPGHQLPSDLAGQKGVAEDSDNRLVANARVSKTMKPFVNRMRMRVKDLDLTDPDAADRLNQARQEMANILKKKKISGTKANQIIAETLDAAANHHLESLRRDQNLEDLAQANRNLGLAPVSWRGEILG